MILAATVAEDASFDPEGQSRQAPPPALGGEGAIPTRGTATDSAMNAIMLAGLPTGPLKNTTGTGVLSIATAADIVNLWGGTCGSSTLLGGDGVCKTVSGGFGGVSTGSNTTAAMTVGTGASLTYSGTGTVNANEIYGAAPRIGFVSGNSYGNWASGATRYLSMSTITSAQNQAQFLAPTTGHMRDLRISALSEQSGGTMVCTVYDGAAATDLAVTIPAGGAAGEYHDTTDVAPVNGGDLISVGCVNNGTGFSALLNSFAFSFTL